MNEMQKFTIELKYNAANKVGPAYRKRMKTVLIECFASNPLSAITYATTRADYPSAEVVSISTGE